MRRDLSWVFSLKTIAVVGASTNVNKPAHSVPQYLKEKGYTIIPVNPNADQIFGEKCYSNLRDIPGSIDIVQMFRPSEEITNFMADILAVSPTVLWMQLGIESEEARKEAEAHGIFVVMNRCMMVEHRTLVGD